MAFPKVMPRRRNTGMLRIMYLLGLLRRQEASEAQYRDASVLGLLRLRSQTYTIHDVA